jgi:hypothetical protein
MWSKADGATNYVQQETQLTIINKINTRTLQTKPLKTLVNHSFVTHNTHNENETSTKTDKS